MQSGHCLLVAEIIESCNILRPTSLLRNELLLNLAQMIDENQPVTIGCGSAFLVQIEL